MRGRFAEGRGGRRRGGGVPGASGSGFSLIELLIVVIIVSISAALALPMLGGTEQTRLRSAAFVLMADMAFAQVESISHGDDPRQVVFDADGGGYYLAASSAPGTAITNPVGNLPYHVRFGSGGEADLVGVRVSATSVGGDNAVQFGMYGELDQATAATVTLVSGAHTAVVTLDPVSGESSVAF